MLILARTNITLQIWKDCDCVTHTTACFVQ